MTVDGATAFDFGTALLAVVTAAALVGFIVGTARQPTPIREAIGCTVAVTAIVVCLAAIGLTFLFVHWAWK